MRLPSLFFEATCDRRGMSVVLSRRSSVPGALRVVWCERQVFHGMGRRAARDAYLITSVNKNPWNYGFFCPFPICNGSVCVAVTCGRLRTKWLKSEAPTPAQQINSGSIGTASGLSSVASDDLRSSIWRSKRSKSGSIWRSSESFLAREALSRSGVS